MIPEENKKILEKIAQDTSFQYEVVATIALNESSCNQDVKPYCEKTWKYFTNTVGEPLKLEGKTATEIQAQALNILGKDEFMFQVCAHGAFQTVGSVLREIRYKEKTPPKDLYNQGLWAFKHLGNLRKQFNKKYLKEPSFEQLYAMYNGGFGSVDANTTKEYVLNYIQKSLTNRKIV